MLVAKPVLQPAMLLALLAGAGCAAEAGSQESKPATQQPRVEAGEPFVDRFASRNGKRWAVSHAWANGPTMVNDWQRSQVEFNRGVTLQLAANVAAKFPFSSGEMQSRSTYGQGYFETTMRAAPGSGIITGFFTYTGPPFGRPWNEIDIEILGAQPDRLQATYFYLGEKVTRSVPLGFDATKGEHHYAFDWQPGFIRWYVDGKLVHSVAGDKLPLPNEAQKLMIHLWGTERLNRWAGEFDASVLPVSAKFGCIAYSLRKPAQNQCRLAGSP